LLVSKAFQADWQSKYVENTITSDCRQCTQYRCYSVIVLATGDKSFLCSKAKFGPPKLWRHWIRRRPLLTGPMPILVEFGSAVNSPQRGEIYPLFDCLYSVIFRIV